MVATEYGRAMPELVAHGVQMDLRRPTDASDEPTLDGQALRPAPEFDASALAKYLLRTIRAGALATLDRAGGFPFASLVTVATDHDGSPLLLTSRLSAHTQNLEQDPAPRSSSRSAARAIPWLTRG